MKIMLAAKWHPADKLTLRSCLEIAEASVLKRPYEDAPVSNEVLFNRKQDLAFQQAVGSKPVWLGAAIFDRRVGLSRTTGQITHETAADVDTERDKLFGDLKETGKRSESPLCLVSTRSGKGATARATPGTPMAICTRV